MQTEITIVGINVENLAEIPDHVLIFITTGSWSLSPGETIIITKEIRDWLDNCKQKIVDECNKELQKRGYLV